MPNLLDRGAPFGWLLAGSIAAACSPSRSAPPAAEPAAGSNTAAAQSEPGPHEHAEHDHAANAHAAHDHAGHEHGAHEHAGHERGDHHEAEHHGHEHGKAGHSSHEHGSAGYAMDFSAADRFAAHFDDPKRDAWQKPEEVMRLLDVRAGQTVVDLGAGTGYFGAALSKRVGEKGTVLALDSEAAMVRHVEKRAREEGWKNAVARQVPENDPELAASSVDRILIVNTWHHISDRERYAAKLGEALRKGGFVLVVDFTMDADIGPPKDHRLPPERVVQELEAGGLRATILKESLPKQYAVQARRD